MPFDLPAVARKKVSAALRWRACCRRMAACCCCAVSSSGLGMRDAVGGVFDGPARPEPDRAHAGGDAAAADVCDCGRLRGRQRLRRAAPRSGLQDGGRPAAGERRAFVLAADLSRLENAPSRTEIARMMAGDGRPVLRQLPAGAGLDHPRHRRHVRCGSWPSAAVAVQRALRRALLSADPYLRRDERQAGGDDPARGQDAVRRGSAHHPQACDRAHPRALAQGRTSWCAATAIMAGSKRWIGANSNGVDYIFGFGGNAVLMA